MFLRQIAVALLIGAVVLMSNAEDANADDGASIVQALNVTLLTEEYPPFNFLDEEGRLRGIGAEVVQSMAAQLGYGKPIQSMAWKRVLQRIDDEENIGVFSMTRTPQREDHYHWVGPIVPANAGIYQLGNAIKPVQSIEDLRNAGLIGVQAGGADEQALRSYGFDNLEPIHNPRGGVHMLATGRIDLLVSSDVELFKQLKDSDLTRSEIEMVYQFSSGDLYLAFSKKTSEVVIRVWQDAYDQVVSQGQFDRIMSQYGVIQGQTPRVFGSLSASQ